MTNPTTIRKYLKALTYIHLMHNQEDFTMASVVRRFRVDNTLGMSLRELGILTSKGATSNIRYFWIGPAPDKGMTRQILEHINRRKAKAAKAKNAPELIPTLEHAKNLPHEVQNQQPATVMTPEDFLNQITQRLDRLQTSVDRLFELWS